MANPSSPAWRFVSFSEAEIEKVPPGKIHHWYCKPGMVPDTNLLLVRARLEPGAAHKFHYHPHLEEILYILSGKAEQWVEREKADYGPRRFGVFASGYYSWHLQRWPRASRFPRYPRACQKRRPDDRGSQRPGTMEIVAALTLLPRAPE